MLGLPYYVNVVYLNRQLRLIAFNVSPNGIVANQASVVQFGSMPYTNARLLVGSVSHATSGVSVDLKCTSIGRIISSHSSNVSIIQPRYSGLVA